MKKHMKGDDGLYHIKGSTYQLLRGSRAQVWHGTAYQTEGGLKKTDLIMNKHDRIVSKLKHHTAKKEKRLQKSGYFTKKGKFGWVKKTTKANKSKKNKRRGKK
tara:strand:- start:209 stop:517 length:309 start_codon:yes stop_codon:yes gene_type:complete